MVAAHERQKFQDPDAGRSRRVGLSRAGQRRAATLLDLAAQGRPLEAALLPGRGPLDSEAAEQRALVQDRARLVRSVAEAERLDGVALRSVHCSFVIVHLSFVIAGGDQDSMSNGHWEISGQ